MENETEQNSQHAQDEEKKINIWEWVSIIAVLGFFITLDFIPFFTDYQAIIRGISMVLFPLGYIMQYKNDRKKLLLGLVLLILMLLIIWVDNFIAL